MLDDLLRRLRRGAAWIYAGSGIGNALDLVAVSIIAHQLGLNAFGVFIAARALTGFVNSLIGARSWDVLYAYWNRLLAQHGAVSGVTLYALCNLLELSLALLSSLIVVLLSAWAEVFGVVADETELLLLLTLYRYSGANLVNINQAVYRLNSAFALSGAQAALGPILRVTGVVALAASGMGSLLLYAAIDGGATLLSWALGAALIKYRWAVPVFIVDKMLVATHAREIWTFSSWNWTSGGVKGFNAHAPELLLGVLATPEAVGAFGLARRLAMFVSAGLDPVLQTITPEVYRMVAAKNKVDLVLFLSYISKLTLIASAVLNLPVWLFSRDIVTFAGGNEFIPAATPLLLVVLAFSIQFVLSWCRPVLLAYLQPRRVLLGELAMSAMLLAIGIPLIPLLGADGAAWAILLGYALRSLVLLRHARRTLAAVT